MVNVMEGISICKSMRVTIHGLTEAHLNYVELDKEAHQKRHCAMMSKTVTDERAEHTHVKDKNVVDSNNSTGGLLGNAGGMVIYSGMGKDMGMVGYMWYNNVGIINISTIGNAEIVNICMGITRMSQMGMNIGRMYRMYEIGMNYGMWMNYGGMYVMNTGMYGLGMKWGSVTIFPLPTYQ